MKISPALLAVLFLLTATSVQAGKVAYILNNPNFADQTIIEELGHAGFTVDLYANTALPDFNTYDFMVLTDQTYSNWQDIPMNQFPALTFNTRYISNWGWASQNSKKSSSQPLSVAVNDNTHFMTDGFPNTFRVYQTSSANYNYLHRYYRAPALRPIAATSDSSVWELLNGVVLTAEPGTKLRDGKTSQTKTVFFGIDVTSQWTPQTKELFRNAAVWLTIDFQVPRFLDARVTDRTNSSLTIAWETNKPSLTSITLNNSTIEDPALKTSHTATFNGLAEDTTYSYTLYGCNADGYCGTSEFYHATTADYTAPHILSLHAHTITNQTAVIHAHWSEQGYCRIHYLGKTTPTSAIGLEAEFLLTGLAEKTSTTAIAEACDTSHNCRNQTITFTTDDYTPPAHPTGTRIQSSAGAVTLQWDPPTDDTARWNIYASATGTFDFTTPLATTSSLSWTDNDAARAQDLTYIIRAEDAHGNEEKNTETLMKTELSLMQGWNLISLPLVPSTTDLAAIMHHSSSYHPVDEIRGWEAEAQQFITTYWSGTGWSNPSFAQIEWGRGYFFHSPQENRLIISGNAPSPVTLSIKSGMNLIGSIAERQPEELFSAPVREIASRTQTGRYDRTEHIGGTWQNAFTLKPATGYWVIADIDTELHIY